MNSGTQTTQTGSHRLTTTTTHTHTQEMTEWPEAATVEWAVVWRGEPRNQEKKGDGAERSVARWRLGQHEKQHKQSLANPFASKLRYKYNRISVLPH